MTRLHNCLLLMILATAAGAQDPDRPLVGLAGTKYRRAYAPVLEKRRIAARTVPGTVLEDPDALAPFSALIIVSKGDPGQESTGLSDKAQAVLTDYVNEGGRLLLSLGCTPPPAILQGKFQNFGFGTDWRVVDTEHPITAGWHPGQLIQYGRYRGGIAALGDQGRVLVREVSGQPAVVVAEHGKGILIYTVGDLGHAASYDQTTAELRDRVLRYLVHGKVQERFGPDLMSRNESARREDPVVTKPRLAAGRGAEREVARVNLQALPDAAVLRGYRLSAAADGSGWTLQAPEGGQVFSPWIELPLLTATVSENTRYAVQADVALEGLSHDHPVTAHLTLRFLDAGGVELPHTHYATTAAEPGSEQSLTVADVAPSGAATARIGLTAMLPAGSLSVRQVVLRDIPDTETLMSQAEPLSTDVPHPRLLPPVAAEDFRAWVADTQTGVYGVSRAQLFTTITTRADAWLAETEMTFGDTVLAWPPAGMPEGQGGTRWNPMTIGISDRLMDLALAYRGTGNEAYGRRAVDLLKAVATWPTWYDPVNNRPSLDVGRMSKGAAWAYDLCHDLMTAAEREAVCRAIRRNTLIPLYKALTQSQGNLNSRALWMLGLGSAAIATLEEAEGASLCVRAVESAILEQLDRRATDHPVEGQGYDSWAYGNMLVVLSALRRNLAVDHFDHPFLQVIPRFAMHFLATDRKQHAWLEDAGGSTAYVHWHYPLAILGAVNRDARAGWYLAETGTVDSPRQLPFKLLFFDPATPVQAPSPQDVDAVFPKAGWASLRSGWEPGGTFIAFVCSDSGTGHAQRHQNTFLVYRDDTLMTTDPGYASGRRGALREFARGTVGHNSVLVDHGNQMFKRGQILQFASGDGAAYVMGDATAAYSPALLRRFHRHLLYLKPDLLFVIDDLAAAEQPRTFQWILHPNSRLHAVDSIQAGGAPLEVGAHPVPGPIDVVQDGKPMRVRSLAPAGLAFRYVLYPGAEVYNPYLELEHPAARETVLVNLLEFGDTRAEDVETVVNGAVVTVRCRIEERIYQITLTLDDRGRHAPAIRVVRDGTALLDRVNPGIPDNAPE